MQWHCKWNVFVPHCLLKLKWKKMHTSYYDTFVRQKLSRLLFLLLHSKSVTKIAINFGKQYVCNCVKERTVQQKIIILAGIWMAPLHIKKQFYTQILRSKANKTAINFMWLVVEFRCNVKPMWNLSRKPNKTARDVRMHKTKQK